MEFLNRFDAILVFNPLTEQNLLEVAKLEIKKIEARAARHKVKFKIDQNILIGKIKTLSDPVLEPGRLSGLSRPLAKT